MGTKFSKFVPMFEPPSLDSWLLQRALKNEAMGASRTYVVCAGPEATDVVGYYSLAVGRTGMLQDALLRILQAADIAGIRAILVHALSDKAASFYRERGFMVSPFDPLVLFLALDFVRNRN